MIFGGKENAGDRAMKWIGLFKVKSKAIFAKVARTGGEK